MVGAFWNSVTQDLVIQTLRDIKREQPSFQIHSTYNSVTGVVYCLIFLQLFFESGLIKSFKTKTSGSYGFKHVVEKVVHHYIRQDDLLVACKLLNIPFKRIQGLKYFGDKPENNSRIQLNFIYPEVEVSVLNRTISCPHRLTKRFEATERALAISTQCLHLRYFYDKWHLLKTTHNDLERHFPLEVIDLIAFHHLSSLNLDHQASLTTVFRFLI